MQLIPGNSIAKLKLRLSCSPQQQFIMRTHPRLSSSWALRPLLPLAVVSALTLAACGEHNAAPQKPAGGAAPQVPVGVVTATPAEVGLLTELPGRVEASRVAEIRARSAGILQKRLFTEGSDVKANQVLFEIDAAPYAAAVQSAQANLAQAQANAAQAAIQFERFQALIDTNAISKQDFDNAKASHLQAQAQVKAAQASVRTAQINLGYTKVTAPIAGRIGRALVTEGALVGQGEATALAVVQQIDPLFVNFTQSASDAFALRKAIQAGQLQNPGKQAGAVHIVLDDGSLYEHTGQLLFTDLSVDASTGQVTLRAEVPNPNGLLLPGQYVRIRLEQAQVANAIALPQQAVTRTEQGDMVTVVSPEGATSPRKVQVRHADGNRWLVDGGLQAGEQVMVDGFQKLQMLPPGTPVKAVPWQAPGAAAAPSTAAAAQ